MQSCWDSGVIFMQANKEKGIKSATPMHIHNLQDIEPAIRKLCKKNKVFVGSDSQSNKY